MYQCPKCGGRLEVIKSNDNHLDKCLMCGGLWFDKNELISVLTGDIDYMIDGIRDDESKEYDNRTGLCPLCNVSLDHVNSEIRDDISIDRCPDCHGVWLDKGELTTLSLQAKKDALLQILNS